MSDKKLTLLSIGILDITFFFLLFSWQQYFSLFASLCLLVIFGCGIIFLLLATINDAKETESSSRWLSIISAIAILYELYFDFQYNIGLFGKIFGYFPIVVAAAIPVIVIYFAVNKFKPTLLPVFNKKIVLEVIILFLILSIITSYIVVSSLQGMKWKGTDEIAYDYYSSHVFLNGSNPYTTNMNPIVNQLGLDPTLRVNSSCECQYGYPAISFLPLAVLQLINLNIYPASFVYITVLCVALAAFIVYYKSNRSASVLLLLFFFVALAYALTPAGDMKYIAVSLLLLVAYIEIKRVYLSSILLGLAASTHPLSWIAIPFFYVLVLNEHGTDRLLKTVLISALTFLAVNSYFILLSPQAFFSNMLVFGGKLSLTGPSLMQTLAPFFSVPYWFPTFLVILFYLTGLVLFYLYAKTLKALLALLPATIFFFSAVNDFVYFLSFVPLLLVICFSTEIKIEDKIKNKKWIKYACLFSIGISLIVLILAHISYSTANTLQVNSLYFTFNTLSGTSGALYALQVNVTNNGNRTENLLFHTISINPNYDRYVVGVPTYVIYPHSSKNFSYHYNLSSVNSGTRVYVYVSSDDYAQGAEFAIPNS